MLSRGHTMISEGALTLRRVYKFNSCGDINSCWGTIMCNQFHKHTLLYEHLPTKQTMIKHTQQCSEMYFTTAILDKNIKVQGHCFQHKQLCSNSWQQAVCEMPNKSFPTACSVKTRCWEMTSSFPRDMCWWVIIDSCILFRPVMEQFTSFLFICAFC